MELGIFAQDAWKVQRLTLNLGIRYDQIDAGFPAADCRPVPSCRPATPMRVTAFRSWNDINPRIGAAFDVFGNGRTALRTSLGRYNQLSRADFTIRFHPFNSSINSASRHVDRQQQQLHPGLRPEELQPRRISARLAGTSAA